MMCSSFTLETLILLGSAAGLLLVLFASGPMVDAAAETKVLMDDMEVCFGSAELCTAT